MNMKLRLASNLTSISDTFINGPAPELGAPHILNVSFIGVRGEVLLHALEEKGIYVSTGSACSAHKRAKTAYSTPWALWGTGRKVRYASA